MDPAINVVASVLRGDKIASDELTPFAPHALVRLLHQHGVAVLFRARLRENAGLVIPDELNAGLAAVHRAATMRAMVHEQAVRRVAEALDGSPWLLWRGLQLARLLYDDVSHRVGADVDLLIRAHDRPQVCAALTAAGFSPHVIPANVSHEMNFVGHGASLDLHWQVLRPHRSRIDLGAWMMTRLATRDGGARGVEQFPLGLNLLRTPQEETALDVATPDMTATLVMLLVHTAITEHVTGRLIRAVDIDRVLRRGDIDWQAALTVIEQSGLATAAWATLTWTRALFASPLEAHILEALTPGRLRQRYIEAWLRHDPAKAYCTSPMMVRAGFSLALQDDALGVARALAGVVQARFA